jgi:uncharacterized membrane protein YhaH (DUF805 family)
MWSCYWSGWKKTFVYKGNATRKDFWSFVFGNILLGILIVVLSYFWLTSYAEHGDGGMALVWAYYIIFPLRIIIPLLVFFPVLSLGIRRMHDIGKSGWWFGGLIAFNQFGLPLLVVVLAAFIDPSAAQNVVIYGYWGLYVISALFIVWLCCKPTKIKETVSLPEIMD